MPYRRSGLLPFTTAMSTKPLESTSLSVRPSSFDTVKVIAAYFCALCRCRSSSWPTPPENMIGFRYSRRSPFGMRCAKERVKPVITGSPKLLP